MTIAMRADRVALLGAAVLLAALLALPAEARQCKPEPVEVNYCGVQKPGEARVQNATVRLWEAEAGRKWGRGWSQWINAQGRLRCRMVGIRTCCNVAGLPCKP